MGLRAGLGSVRGLRKLFIEWTHSVCRGTVKLKQKCVLVYHLKYSYCCAAAMTPFNGAKQLQTQNTQMLSLLAESFQINTNQLLSVQPGVSQQCQSILTLKPWGVLLVCSTELMNKYEYQCKIFHITQGNWNRGSNRTLRVVWIRPIN